MNVSLGTASIMEIHAGGPFISETILPDACVTLVMKACGKGVLYGKQRCFQPELILF